MREKGMASGKKAAGAGRWTTLLVILPLLGACASLGTRSSPMPMGSSPLPVIDAAPASNGAVYTAGNDMTLFADLRARRVGDLLTIVLQEATSASKSASTSTKKGTDIGLPGPTLGGRPVTVNGTQVLDMSLSGDRQFDGEGSASQSNQLRGSITVTVVQRLANGNLVVQGQKWLRLNHGDEFVQIAGIVRPRDVGEDNTVGSDRVADARISYGGKGVIANANQPGWLDRFFNSPVMPY
jgi:flagellar L-ring protein precursor FlgH